MRRCLGKTAGQPPARHVPPKPADDGSASGLKADGVLGVERESAGTCVIPARSGVPVFVGRQPPAQADDRPAVPARVGLEQVVRIDRDRVIDQFEQRQVVV